LNLSVHQIFFKNDLTTIIQLDTIGIELKSKLTALAWIGEGVMKRFALLAHEILRRLIVQRASEHALPSVFC
jgi:hypothetical protein